MYLLFIVEGLGQELVTRQIGYKSYLEEGVGKLPFLQALLRHQEAYFSLKEAGLFG